MRIIYVVPDNPKPSWGVGIIYHHVSELNKAGKHAFIMHQKKGFTLDWLSLKVPVLYYSEEKNNLAGNDILVVPEVMMDLQGLKNIQSKKIVFIQNIFYMYLNMPKNETHISLGFKEAFYIMPHILPVINNHLKLPAYIIPPFIADYFFKDTDNLHKRDKTIIVYPKHSSLDYGILIKLIEEAIRKANGQHFLHKLINFSSQWKLNVLTDKSHTEVASIMQKAAFFINLNTFEAFNTSVPEAMAAGCINICYEAVGPADFVIDNVNAFVYPNNHIYSLVQKVIELITNYDNLQEQLILMRTKARITADAYTLSNMSSPLLEYFNQ